MANIFSATTISFCNLARKTTLIQFVTTTIWKSSIFDLFHHFPCFAKLSLLYSFARQSNFVETMHVPNCVKIDLVYSSCWAAKKTAMTFCLPVDHTNLAQKNLLWRGRDVNVALPTQIQNSYSNWKVHLNMNMSGLTSWREISGILFCFQRHYYLLDADFFQLPWMSVLWRMWS